MTAATVYNTTPGPLVIDAQGHTIGGYERRDDVDVDGRTVDGRVARPLLDAGLLLDVSESGASSPAPEAEAAVYEEADGDEATDRTEDEE